MLPPMQTLDMIKFMHEELHEKREQSQQRELVAHYSEHRAGGIVRLLARRFRRQSECREYCDGELIEPATI